MNKILGLANLFSGSKKRNPTQRIKGFNDAWKERTRSFGVGGFRHWNDQAIFIPRRRKLKGWMKDNLKWGRK